MNRAVAWLVLACLAIGMGYLLWTDSKTRFVWLSMLIVLPLLLGSAYIATGISERVRASRAEQRLATLLGERTLEEVLEQSVYTSVWAGQGSAAYFIVRKEGGDAPPVATLPDEGAARLWIVEDFLNRSVDG